MKIKLIIDSSCGLTEKQANELGWDLLPLISNINGTEYKNGVNIDIQKFAELWNANPKKAEVKTSCSLLKDIVPLVEKYEKEYDKIVIYPISKALSSQSDMLKTAFANHDKVFVVESNKILYLMIKDLLMFEEEIKAGKSFEEATKIFSLPASSRFLLIPEFNDALVKGGRLAPAAAAIAKLLKIVPIICWTEDGRLEKYGTGFKFRNSLLKQTINMKKEYNKKIDENTYFILIDSQNSNIKEIAEELKNAINFSEVEVFDNAVDVAVHTGVGAICLAIDNVDPKIKDKLFKFTKKY